MKTASNGHVRKICLLSRVSNPQLHHQKGYPELGLDTPIGREAVQVRQRSSNPPPIAIHMTRRKAYAFIHILCLICWIVMGSSCVLDPQRHFTCFALGRVHFLTLMDRVLSLVSEIFRPASVSRSTPFQPQPLAITWGHITLTAPGCRGNS